MKFLSCDFSGIKDVTLSQSDVCCFCLFLSDEGPTLEALDFTVRIRSKQCPFTSRFVYLQYSAYVAHYVYLTKITSLCMPYESLYPNGYPS